MKIDTTPKRMMTPVNKMSYPTNDFLMYFKEGIVQLKQDSFEKGSRLLLTAVQHAESLKKIHRAFPYFGLELFDLIEDINSGLLSPEEKKLGFLFLKLALTQDVPPNEKLLATEFKRAPNTVFTRRLKIYVLSMSSSPKTGRELDDLLKDKPQLITANLLKAEYLYEEEKYEESIHLCDKIIKLSPEYAYVYHLRGKNFSGGNESEKAIADFKEAIRLFPDEDETYYDLANAQVENNNYRDAIDNFYRIKRVNSNYSLYHYNLARCYNGLNMTDSALYHIDKYILLYPDNSYGYDIKGDIYYAKEDYNTAIEIYTHAISLNPTKASLYEDRGDAYYYDKKYEDAISDFKKSVSLDKHRAYTTDRIGDCYYQLNAFDKAIPYHQKAIGIDSSYKYAYVSLNMVYNRTGNYLAAIANAKKAIQIDSTYSSAYGDLGWTYYLTGNFDACIEYSYKAIKYDETATYAMFNIGLATLCKGNFEKAKEIYSYYVTHCKEKDYKISAGASEDLNDLIKKGKFVTEARYILEHIFEEKK